jgi:protein-disulfide isomerase
MPKHLTSLLTIALVVAACATSVAAYRISTMRVAVSAGASGGPIWTFLPGWEDGLTAGSSITGAESAPIKLVVLFDLECNVCGAFHHAVLPFAEEHSATVELIYVHFPLPYHRFALPAARAAECAAHAGAFRSWLDAVYAKQDSLGLKSWGSFAAEAAIADTLAIHKCAVSPESHPQIDAGAAWAERIGAKGTPTVIVNGWRYSQTPSIPELGRVVSAINAGQVP